MHQISGENVKKVIKKLETLGSTSISQFKSLFEETKIKIEEALANTSYLKILLGACNEIKEPEDIEIHISDILLLLRFIHLDSSFYIVSYGLIN